MCQIARPKLMRCQAGSPAAAPHTPPGSAHSLGVVVLQGALLAVQPLRLAFHAHKGIMNALLVGLNHLQEEEW